MIWASPGGIAPMEPSKDLDCNIDCPDKDHTMDGRTTPSPAREPEQEQKIINAWAHLMALNHSNINKIVIST